MKKIILFIASLFIVVLIGLSIFSSTNYFFNHYIAKNIKQYGFSYTYVKGALFDGFVVEGLKYKHKILAYKVELKIDPLYLLKGIVSAKKITLAGVREDTLEKLLRDFHPSDSNESTLNIDFELHNILLTVRPFHINDIYIKKNNLQVAYLKYINNKFNIGKVNYEAETNLGSVSFKGNFNHRVLHIERLKVVKLRLKKLVSILKGIKSEGKEAEYHLENNPFIPKKVTVKLAELAIAPFSIEGINSKKLLLHISDTEFDITKLLLKRASIQFKYDGNLLYVDTVAHYNNRYLTIEKLNLNFKKLQKIEDIIKKIASLQNGKKSISNVKIVPIDNVKIVNSTIKVSTTTYKKQKIHKVLLSLKQLSLNLLKKKIESLDGYLLNIDSSLAKIEAKGKIDKLSTSIESINFSIANVDKLRNFLLSIGKDGNNSRKKIFSIQLPQKLYIQNVTGKIGKLSFEPYRIKKGTIFGKTIGIDLNKSEIFDGNVILDTDSNWGRAKLDGYLKKNNYFAKGLCKPNQELFDKYSIPIKAKNLETITVRSRFGFQDFDINATLQGKNILTVIKGISVIKSNNRIKYNYHKNSVLWSIQADVTSPYLKRAKIENNLSYKNNKLRYWGTLKSPTLSFVKQEYLKLFRNIVATYKGDTEGLDMQLLSAYLKGNFSIKKYKSAFIEVANRKRIPIKEFLTLPQNLSDLTLNSLQIKLPIDFAKPLPLKGDLKIVTNLGTLLEKWQYHKSIFSMDGKLNIPKKSLLFKKYAQLNKENIKELRIALNIKENILKVIYQNSLLNGEILYDINHSLLNKATLQLDSFKIDAHGNMDKIEIQTKTFSLKKLQYSLAKLFKMKINDKIDGKLELNGVIEKLNRLNITIISPKLLYGDKKSFTEINDLLIQGSIDDNSVIIKKYSAIVKGYKVYSNKKGIIRTKDFNNFKLVSFWINDSLKVNGIYSLKEKKGNFDFQSQSFKIENSDIFLNLAIDAKVHVARERVATSGTIIVVDGFIKKVLGAKNIAENSDIIILQRQKRRESTKFAKNIKLKIKIKSKKGVLYKHGGNQIRILPNLTIVKEYNHLSKFNGEALIAKNSYYFLNGKKLVVQKGSIIFKGKSMSPNLDIILIYRGREYTITINIIGTPTHPILYFSSEPALNKDQILAYLLFDDASAAGTHDQAAMLNTLGGSIAKSFLGSLGIKIDHISIKENGFSIGKSLGKHVIIYYNQENQEPSVKTRVDITKSVHSDIEIGKEKQSADIIFSGDY